MYRSVFFLVFSLLVIINLVGCSTRLSGASSLQVDVEVYKGPLSEEPIIQASELAGLLSEFKIQLTNFKNAIDTDIIRDKICSKSKIDTLSCQEFNEIVNETNAMLGGNTKRHSANPRVLLSKYPEKDLNFLVGSCQNIEDKRSTEELKNCLKKISKFAIKLKASAFYWAENQIALPAGSPIIGGGLEGRAARITVTTYVNLLAEYANQLNSRADALLKQLDTGTGVPRQYLPTATILRDTNPTDFLNLYTWNRAAGLPTVEEMVTHPFHAFSSDDTADRVRGFERLFNDHYWSKINTVYTSGQGQVGTALIRDEIGNWMLKSFENYPGELVKAYWGLTKAGVEGAAELVGAAASGGSSEAIDKLPEVLSTVGRLMGGQITPATSVAANINTGALRVQTLQNLKNIQKDIENLDPKDTSSIEGKLKEARDALDDYERVIVTLQQGAITAN